MLEKQDGVEWNGFISHRPGSMAFSCEQDTGPSVYAKYCEISGYT
jgi:hypothetical protein